MEIITNIITLRQFIVLIVSVVAAIGGSTWVMRRERRLIRNLSRRMIVIASQSRDMKVELDMFRRTGFFNIPESPSSDLRQLDNLSDCGLIIVAYSEGETDVGKVLSQARGANVPVIIYAKQGEIKRDGEDMKTIQEYSLAEIANSPLRLLNVSYSILSVYEPNTG